MRRALMFPGQGSQAVGMGVELAESETLVAATFDEASQELGYDLLELCARGPVELLARTDITQPALLTVSVAIWRLLKSDGVRHGVSFGHSLGEYSALVAGGALPFAQALRLVRRRGEEMRAAGELHPGAMVAVIGLDDEVVAQLCATLEAVWPANFNSPGQVVVSVARSSLEAFVAAAKAAGARRVVPLAVGGAFHSPLMEPALDGLREELAAVEWSTPEPAFFSVCSLEYESSSLDELLLRQLVSPVRFRQAVEQLNQAGYDSFLEVGAGSVLSGLVRRIAPQAHVERVADRETLAAFRESSRQGGQ